MQFVRPLIGASVTGVLLLSGCSLFGTPEPTTTSAAPSPTASETTPAGDGTFAAPADCLTILPKDQIDSYAAENIILLAGPGGIYGDELIPDPTPDLKPEATLEVLAVNYPQFANAFLEGPSIESGKQVFTVKVSAGTKG